MIKLIKRETLSTLFVIFCFAALQRVCADCGSGDVEHIAALYGDVELVYESQGQVCFAGHGTRYGVVQTCYADSIWDCPNASRDEIVVQNYTNYYCYPLYMEVMKNIEVYALGATPGEEYELNLIYSNGNTGTRSVTADGTGRLEETIELPVEIMVANSTVQGEVSIEGSWFEGKKETCVPPTPIPSSGIPYPDMVTGSDTGYFYEPSTFGAITYTFYISPGELSDVKYSRTFSKDGGLRESSECGYQIDTINRTPPGWNTSFSVGIPIGTSGFSLGGSWSRTGGDSYTLFDGADSEAESGVYKYGQIYKQYHKLTSGVLSNCYSEVTNMNSQVTVVRHHQNEPVQLNCSPELYGYTYRVCEVCCN